MPTFRPGLAGILAEYLVFDPDPAAGWLREGGPPTPPRPKSQKFQTFESVQSFETFQMIGPIQPLQPVELVQSFAMFELFYFRFGYMSQGGGTLPPTVPGSGPQQL